MSVKVTFVRDFDYRTPRGSIVAYTAGYSGSIPQPHFDAAQAAKAIEEPEKRDEK